MRGLASSRVSRRQIAKTSDNWADSSSGVSQPNAVDSSEVRSVPPGGVRRKTRGTMPSVVFFVYSEGGGVVSPSTYY